MTNGLVQHVEESTSIPWVNNNSVIHSILKSTLMCLSIGTHKIINFPFVSNGKLMVFECPNSQAP